MKRRRTMLSLAAAIVIGAAAAALPKSVSADRAVNDQPRRDLWVPGTNMVMSAHETQFAPPAPPR